MKKIKKYPRKLKKGMRAVMNGKPKTKWQRKGVLYRQSDRRITISDHDIINIVMKHKKRTL